MGDIEALHLAFDDQPFPTARLSDTGEHEVTSPHLEGDDTPSGTHRLRATKVTALRRAIAAGSGSPEVKAEPQAPKAAVGAVRKKPSILFVDDEERVLNALRMLFHQTYDVTVATGGEEALQLAKSRPFHVIVSDQRMPGMLGVELLRELKVVAPNSVRMLLTGYSDLAAIVGSVNDGEVFRFVSKPWNQDDLQATIGEAVTIAIALEASPPPRVGTRSTADVAALVLDDAPLARGARDVGRSLPWCTRTTSTTRCMRWR
jgi:CheY-like chemotaxis protein